MARMASISYRMERDGWKHNGNPRLDETVCAALREIQSRGHYRKVVKLLKYWNDVYFEEAFTSYYVELALANHFSALMNSGTENGICERRRRNRVRCVEGCEITR